MLAEDRPVERWGSELWDDGVDDEEKGPPPSHLVAQRKKKRGRKNENQKACPTRNNILSTHSLKNNYIYSPTYRAANLQFADGEWSGGGELKFDREINQT